MTVTKKLFLFFPHTEADKPVIYHLVKDFDLMVNIFRAKVTPEENGYLVLDVSGDDEKIAAGIEFIKTSFNIEINDSSKGLRWDAAKCTHCGNCVPHCPTDALSIPDRNTMLVCFDEDQCIQCLNCLQNCPYGAVSSLF